LEEVQKKELQKTLAIITQLVSDGIDIKTFLTSCLAILEQDLLSGKDVSDLMRVSPMRMA